MTDSRINVLSIDGLDNVTVAFTQPVPASERGTLLLDCEDYMRAHGLPNAIVWHEPLGDRNSLRNLRGIEVKA